MFYDDQMDGSLRSANRYCGVLARKFAPRSVLDIGCGRGTWLKAFADHGAERLLGFDGDWNSPDKMIDPRIEFRACNLESIPFIGERFDLAMSVEVAEHLSAAASDGIVGALCTASDVILFGAAIPGQGGTNHINEQPQSYWAGKFQSRGFRPIDLFRAKVWDDRNVEYWYRQNTFLYCREDSEAYRLFADFEIEGTAFMDIRHPALTGGRIYLKLLVEAIRKRLGFR